MTRQIEIKGRAIGPGHPVFVVAELSANHNQELAQALQLVEIAKEAGADAVKLQTYTPETMTIRSDAEPFRVGAGTAWEGRNLYDLYEEAQTPWEWYPAIARACDEAGLTLFSTPFDTTALNYLESMGAPAHKVASFELVDIPLLREIGATGKPVIISTGMATADEISEAIDSLRVSGATQIALLKCTSAYPARPEEMNLSTIPDLATRFGLPVGLSDHTLDIVVPVTAVALGACIIEKHLTVSREVSGPDQAFSLEPNEFKAMVAAVRTAEASLGHVQYGATERERPNLLFRRSLFVVAPILGGEAFTSSNVRVIRPGHGLHPRYLDQVVGRAATRDLSPGTPLGWEIISGGQSRPEQQLGKQEG